MRRLKIATVGVLVVAALYAGSGQAPGAASTLFEGARLITGDGAPPIENSAFIVERGQFGRVGRKGEIPLAAGMARIDLTGKTVMPALIDAHAHVGYTKGLTDL